MPDTEPGRRETKREPVANGPTKVRLGGLPCTHHCFVAPDCELDSAAGVAGVLGTCTVTRVRGSSIP